MKHNIVTGLRAPLFVYHNPYVIPLLHIFLSFQLQLTYLYSALVLHSYDYPLQFSVIQNCSNSGTVNYQFFSNDNFNPILWESIESNYKALFTGLNTV